MNFFDNNKILCCPSEITRKPQKVKTGYSPHWTGKPRIRLNTSSVLNVPLQTYTKDFTFIVNRDEFKTSRLHSDLLSPIICQLHASDPTIDRFEINTQHQGNFSTILQLVNFQTSEISTDNLPFISEVIQLLGNESIEIHHEHSMTELNIDNVFTLLRQHERCNLFYRSKIDNEIEYAAVHFFEVSEKHEEELRQISIDTLMRIIKHDKLRLKTEDQLLHIITDLYAEDSSYSILYESIMFDNVSTETIRYFTGKFEPTDMTRSTWTAICERLEQEIEKDGRSVNRERYEERSKGQKFEFTGNNEFNGIFNHLRTQTGQIENSVNFTGNVVNNNDCYQPRNVALFGNDGKFYESKNEPNSWICFEFKEHHVIPTHYTIKSVNWRTNSHHPKSWIIEGSKDNKDWTTIDVENNNAHLNGISIVHTFAMNHPVSTEFKYIRMKSTGTNWGDNNHLIFNSFELYGTLI